MILTHEQLLNSIGNGRQLATGGKCEGLTFTYYLRDNIDLHLLPLLRDFPYLAQRSVREVYSDVTGKPEIVVSYPILKVAPFLAQAIVNGVFPRETVDPYSNYLVTQALMGRVVNTNE